MLRAFIFDFNGVIVDDESIHFSLFQKVLAKVGVSLTENDYYQKYLGYDDHDCFSQAAKDNGKKIGDLEIENLIRQKETYYKEHIHQGIVLVPGVKELITALARQYYVAVVSGALRSEIEALLEKNALVSFVDTVVAAEDVQHGKPHPDGYLQVLRVLNRDFVSSSEVLLTHECLVFEDSPWGVQSARSAGMHVVGITTSFSEEQLEGTLECFKDFSNIEISVLEKLVSGLIH